MAAALEIVAQAVDPGISLMYICNSVSSSEAEVLFQVSKLLKHKGINVNITNRDGYSPLLVAVTRNLVTVVDVLLTHKDIDVNKTNNKGMAPLHCAADKGYGKIVSSLLKHKDIRLNQAMPSGITALWAAARQGHNMAVAALLRKEGVDVNASPNDGRTPLYVASFSGHIDVVRMLLSAKGVEIARGNNEGITPAAVAKKNGFTAIMDMLNAVSFTNMAAARSAEEEESCAICLEALPRWSYDFMRHSCCGKAMHLKCAKSFVDSDLDKNCPLCRTPCPTTDAEAHQRLLVHAGKGRAWAMNQIAKGIISEKVSPSQNPRQDFGTKGPASRQVCSGTVCTRLHAA